MGPSELVRILLACIFVHTHWPGRQDRTKNSTSIHRAGLCHLTYRPGRHICTHFPKGVAPPRAIHCRQLGKRVNFDNNVDKTNKLIHFVAMADTYFVCRQPWGDSIQGLLVFPDFCICFHIIYDSTRVYRWVTEAKIKVK